MQDVANKWNGWYLFRAVSQDDSSCICVCFGIYGGIYIGWRLYSGVVGVVRGAILSAEVPPIISQLAADCVQSLVELQAAIALVTQNLQERERESERK